MERAAHRLSHGVKLLLIRVTLDPFNTLGDSILSGILRLLILLGCITDTEKEHSATSSREKVAFCMRYKLRH